MTGFLRAAPAGARYSSPVRTALAALACLALIACGSSDDDDGGGLAGAASAGGHPSGGGTSSSSGGSSSGTIASGGSASSGGGRGGTGTVGSGGSGRAGSPSTTAGRGGTGGTEVHTPSAGRSGAGGAGVVGPPSAGPDGLSPYERECHGDTVSCEDVSTLRCLGIRDDTTTFGYSCSNSCETDADCSDAPSSGDASASCVDFVTQKHCLLLCLTGGSTKSCPSGMSCYVYPQSPIGYCLWQ